MAIIYRTSGPWGAGKGANLVAGEIDGNFYDTDRRIAQIEDTMPELANGIAFFSVSGAAFYVHMTDGTIQGPFQLPQKAWNFRGAWQDHTLYYLNDVITANGGTYMVLINHTSGGSFDAGANDGFGHNFYGLLLTNPGNVLPTGGAAGMYLVKVTGNDFDVGWQTPVVFPAQKLLEAPDATYVLTLNNIASYVRCINASGCTIVIPSDETLDFPIASEVSFRQCTASGVVLTNDTGVILNRISGLGTRTNRQGAVITAKKIAADVWDVFGLLST